MEYNQFKQIFNETIFKESKADLLKKIASSPPRYIGLFRPTKPKAKILQNLLQSHEIRFGDAFERVIEKYLQIKGCKILQKLFTKPLQRICLKESLIKKRKSLHLFFSEFISKTNTEQNTAMYFTTQHNICLYLKDETTILGLKSINKRETALQRTLANISEIIYLFQFFLMTITHKQKNGTY